MPIIVWIAAAAIVAAVPMLVWSLTTRGAVSSAAVRRNLGFGAPDLRERRLQVSPTERLVLPVLETVAHLGRSLLPAGRVERLERQLALAGVIGRWTPQQVLGAKVLAGAAAGVAVGLYFFGQPSLGRLLLAVGGTAGAFLAPDLLLRQRAKERQRQMESDLPDLLDQLTISVEAGLAFDAALQRVVRSGSGPLVEEFGRMLQDVQVGTRRSEAFEQLIERTEAADVRHVVKSLIHADRHGSPLAKTLRLQAKEIRLKRRTRAEEAANKIAIKLLFPVVFCLFPALFIVILGPAMLRIADAF